MKIPGNDSVRLLDTYLLGVKKSDSGPAGQPGCQTADKAKDTVEFSKDANDLSKLNDLVASAPETRFNLVAEIRKKLESGTYNSEADKIAEDLLRSAVTDAIL